MREVVHIAFSFPCVVYTVLLGVVLVYWLFVVLGAIHLGDGSADGAFGDFDAEGAIGASKGALEGAAKGALHWDGLGDGAGDVPGASDFADGGDGEPDFDQASAAQHLLNALHLRSVPATAIFSLIVTFSWLACSVGMQLVSRNSSAGAGSSWRLLVFVVSPVLALPLTSLAARPLSRLFAQRKSTTRHDLIGKTCIVRTGTVTSTFGEALLEDGGAGLVVRVRVDRALDVKRGDHVLIVDWDSEHESFLVEPVDPMLSPPR